MRFETALAASDNQCMADLFDCWGVPIDTFSEANLQDSHIDHTAYQWCVLGPVPIIDARWKPVTYGHSDSAWYYCSNWNVRYEPGRAKELLKTGPQEYDRLPHGRPYDGHPWWQAKKRGGSKTLPVASAVSTSLPAGPVNPASVVDIDNKDDENIVLDIDNYPIVADPIAPET